MSLLLRRGRFTLFLFTLGTMLLTGIHLHLMQYFFKDPVTAGDPALTASPGQAASQPSPGREPLRVWEGRIRRGTGLAESLRDAGLAPGQIAGAVESLAPVIDLRRLRSGTRVSVAFDAGGDPVRITCQSGLLEEAVLERRRGGWEVRHERVAAETRVETVSGSIKTSLFESLAALGEQDRLTADFVDIFAWDIDFSHELRKEDTFRIVVEKIYREGAFLTYGRILAAEYRDREELHRAFFFPFPEGGGDYYTPEGQSLRKTFLRAPVSYSRISSGYSRRRLHPILKKTQPHLGVDYAAPPGTPVWAPAEGTVLSTSRDSANGKKIVLRHPNGYTTYYLHLARFAPGIRKGRKVTQKQIIGYVGSSGRSTGPHLDYRMKKGGRWVNPLKQKFPPGKPLPEERLAEFSRYREWLTGRLSSPPGAFLADAQASRP